MSTPNQPTNTTQGTYIPTVPLGGTLAAAPQPNEPFFPLRRDQFLTFCDGEMSGARSIRDACIGAFATGVVGIIGMLVTMDWDSALKQGRHPIFWTVVLFVFTLTALILGVFEWVGMYRTRSKSSYSRLLKTIAEYFGISVPS